MSQSELDAITQQAFARGAEYVTDKLKPTTQYLTAAAAAAAGGLVTVKQLALIYDVSTDTIYRWTKDLGLSYRVQGSTRFYDLANVAEKIRSLPPST